jgi:hypothetical protein
MPMEEVEDYVPSQPPMELAQPPKAGAYYEPASKTFPPQDEPDQEFVDTQQSRVRNDPEQEPRPWSDVNVDYEPMLPGGAMRWHSSCAYDLGMEDEERFSTRRLCHLERPGAAV